jgi:hypothetical protein
MHNAELKGFRCQVSARLPAAEAAGLIGKETVKKEYRISNKEYRMPKE